MYTKHHTRGIVLAHYDRGEADRVYALLTPDLGKVYVHARGVRRENARNRAALQTLSRASVSLVRGKGGWRITNTAPVDSLYVLFAHEPEKLAVLVRIVRLLKRLLAGEGEDKGIYAIIEACAEALSAPGTARASLEVIETITVMRLLSLLGYMKDDIRFAHIFANSIDFSDEIIESVRQEQKQAVSLINEALEASQL